MAVYKNIYIYIIWLVSVIRHTISNAQFQISDFRKRSSFRMSWLMIHTVTAAVPGAAHGISVASLLPPAAGDASWRSMLRAVTVSTDCTVLIANALLLTAVHLETETPISFQISLLLFIQLLEKQQNLRLISHSYLTFDFFFWLNPKAHVFTVQRETLQLVFVIIQNPEDTGEISISYSYLYWVRTVWNFIPVCGVSKKRQRKP